MLKADVDSSARDFGESFQVSHANLHHLPLVEIVAQSSGLQAL
jgi:hypothetical protein